MRKSEKIIPHAPSLEKQIDDWKRSVACAIRFNMDIVYGEEALSLLKETKCISMKDFVFKGEVGSELYKESVDNYCFVVKKTQPQRFRPYFQVVGVEIYIDDNVERVFASKRINGLCGVLAYYFDSSSYHDKILKPISLGGFGVSLPVYNRDDASPTGEFVSQATDDIHNVYDAVKDCKTYFDIWNVLKGKCLRATSNKRFFTAKSYVEVSNKRKYVSTELMGLTCFSFVNRSLNKVTSPELCYREYHIVSNKNGKWGIFNEEKDELIVDFFFDKIEWCRYDITKEAKYVFFYKNGKMAMWSTKELERLVQ